jgi:hypothetical protein
VERNGKRVGFLQRTSQYWPNNHEALEARAGVAVIKAYTAYQPVYYKDGTLPPNRPGTPPVVLTWCDRDYLDQFKQDVSALKAQCDVAVSSHHMGHRGDILDFQVEIAHAAIDSGADVVMAHAEHYPLAIEVYKGKNPAMIRIVVVLPAPFGPRKPSTSPGCTRKLRSSTARSRPYSLVRPWQSIIRVLEQSKKISRRGAAHNSAYSLAVFQAACPLASAEGVAVGVDDADFAEVERTDLRFDGTQIPHHHPGESIRQ